MKKVFIVFVVLAGIYALLLSKPELYFGKSFAYKGFTVRAHGELPEQIAARLDGAYEKIAASELFKENASFELIVPSSRGEFVFFTPLQKGEFSRVNPFHGAIFLAAADFKAGEVRTAPGAAQTRRLSSEIAGAAARELSRRLFKPLSYLFRADWEIRGYAAHIAGLTGEFSPPDACSAASTTDLEDYRHGLMVETIMKEDNIGFNELINRNMSFETAEDRMKKTHCGG